MEISILYIFFSFCLFSIMGWILEVSYRSLCAGRFVNPGFLKGPFLVLYGTGSLMLMGCIFLFNLYDVNFIIKIFTYFIAITGLELICGLTGTGLFNIRLWDYSDQFLHYKGHVCLKFSIYWVFLAFGFEYFFLASYQNIFNSISPVFKNLSTAVLISIITIDFIGALLTNIISSKSLEEKEIIELEFINLSRPLLENPQLKALSQCNHHRGKTRLEHVKEVAYLSFQWSRKLSLDSNAIVRGALLHDLFYYDWQHEGPRFHGFRHHNIALKNAHKLTDLSKKEEDIIKKHMWPLTVVPPVYMESLIVSVIDTFCSARDYINFKGHKKTRKPITALDSSGLGE
ncbi:HD domain-containing protein [Desulfobacula sp.]|uniref:putative ABC transporter permease n=1 Tax=Desulfobacula sp. TaxID=2593537 RepID=UPI002624DC7C|nr:HD domain-containing protein [Desulfobacula sp.]